MSKRARKQTPAEIYTEMMREITELKAQVWALTSLLLLRALPAEELSENIEVLAGLTADMALSGENKARMAEAERTLKKHFDSLSAKASAAPREE